MNGRGPSNSPSINETYEHSTSHLFPFSEFSVFCVLNVFQNKKKGSCFLKLFLKIVFKNTKNIVSTFFLLYEFSVFYVFQNKKLNKWQSNVVSLFNFLILLIIF